MRGINRHKVIIRHHLIKISGGCHRWKHQQLEEPALMEQDDHIVAILLNVSTRIY